jgi:hypothetical protein
LTTAGQTVAAGHKAPLCLSQLHSTYKVMPVAWPCLGTQRFMSFMSHSES